MLAFSSVTISTIDAAHADLVAALQQSPAIVLDVTDVAESDLTFIQLIEAARVFALSNGGQLALSAPAGEPLRQILERGGFLDDPASDRAKFWLQGGAPQ